MKLQYFKKLIREEIRKVIKELHDEPYTASSQEGQLVDFYATHGFDIGNPISFEYKNQKGKSVSGDTKIKKLAGNQGIGFDTPSGWVIIPKKFIEKI